MERIGAKGIAFIVSVILARKLSPDDYGTIAIVAVIIQILEVFIDSGFGAALIQKQEVDDIDYSSVFYFNILSCTILYFFVFFSAPFIAKLYNDFRLIAIIRVLCLQFIISGVKNVQQSYVTKNFLFKKFFFSTLGGTILSGVIGIIMAYNGLGVWSLVCQMISNYAIDTLILWFTVDWKPKRTFSFTRLKEMFSFSGRYLGSLLIARITDELNKPIIGLKYSKSDLAFYERGYSLASIITENINNAMSTVLFPTVSSVQDNKERVKSIITRYLTVSTYIIMPMMMGLAVCGERLIKLIFTEKWLPCVPFLYVFCIMYAIYPISIANINVIVSLGVKKLFIRFQLIRSVITIVILIITIQFGVIYIAIGTLIVAIISIIVYSWPTKSLINYSLRNQIIDILPNIFLTIIMGTFIYPIGKLNLPDIIIISLQVIFGIIIYLLGSRFLKLSSFNYLMTLLFHRNKN